LSIFGKLIVWVHILIRNGRKGNKNKRVRSKRRRRKKEKKTKKKTKKQFTREGIVETSVDQFVNFWKVNCLGAYPFWIEEKKTKIKEQAAKEGKKKKKTKKQFTREGIFETSVDQFVNFWKVNCLGAYPYWIEGKKTN
jgi:hypothetical protein